MTVVQCLHHIINFNLVLHKICQIIIKMAAANGVRCVWVGQNGLLSTPAVSAVIREREGKDVSSLPSTIILLYVLRPTFFFFFKILFAIRLKTAK